MSRHLMAIVAVMAAVACTGTDDVLPDLHGQQALQAGTSTICDQVPMQVAFERPVLVQPDNLRHCVSRHALVEAGRRAAPWPVAEPKRLPVTFSVAADGRVKKGVSFWNHCSGSQFAVDAATEACLQRALSEWRYAPDVEGCPLRYFAQENYYVVDVVPRDAEGGVATSSAQSGCS